MCAPLQPRDSFQKYHKVAIIEHSWDWVSDLQTPLYCLSLASYGKAAVPTTQPLFCMPLPSHCATLPCSQCSESKRKRDRATGHSAEICTCMRVVVSVKLRKDPASGAFCGSGLIEFDTVEAALKAVEQPPSVSGATLVVELESAHQQRKRHAELNGSQPSSQHTGTAATSGVSGLGASALSHHCEVLAASQAHSKPIACTPYHFRTSRLLSYVFNMSARNRL